MLKIDRKAFLALALGMSVGGGGCYPANPPPQPAYYPRPAGPPGGSPDPMAAPHEECMGWTPAGECNAWDQGGGAAAAPQDECVGWTPTGECNRWEPTQECVGWTPAGECNRWEPYRE